MVATILCLGLFLIAVVLRLLRSKTWRRRLASVVIVVLLMAAVSGIFLLRSTSSELLRDWTSETSLWRLEVFARKAEGKLPDLSWPELWFMTRARGGFGMKDVVTKGMSLGGTVTNPYVTAEDLQAGARLFKERCAVCHGDGGSGGHAPRLNSSKLSHGDSDLAMYKVVRDGIAGTGMAPIAMTLKERWQIIGYLRNLPYARGEDSAQGPPPVDIQVSAEQIRSGSRPDQWITYSGSLDGRRYTPLAEISRKNVSQLHLRWVHQFDTPEVKSESTPIVVGGMIFTTEPTVSAVVALDAKSGDVIWRYERVLPDKLPVCCYRANRGLAILGNLVFLGSLEGYLVALNATNGKVVWQTEVARRSEGFTMTGAPLVVNRSVVVGVAGGEFGIRGFLAAYDAETGRQQWKFNTIPGPGEFGHETWKNEAWRSGGGPTWVTGSYDPSLDLLYWGTGNPAPGLQGDVRAGDNLFTDSLVALHANSGKLAWYFQFTPHDEHDWDADQTPILADFPIRGVVHQAICVANRNGFYYVLDRRTGEFLLGAPFIDQNWARGLDSTGRPILSSSAEVSPSGRVTKPGVGGGINWQNAAFDGRNGLIFIPATESASVFTKSESPGRGELGFYAGSQTHWAGPPPVSVVRALEVGTGSKKWEYLWPKWYKDGYSGLLATGGGLVFGASGGFASALDSASGRELWRVPLGGDTYAAPISFTVDGRQAILVSAGRAMFLFGL